MRLIYTGLLVVSAAALFSACGGGDEFSSPDGGAGDAGETATDAGSGNNSTGGTQSGGTPVGMTR